MARESTGGLQTPSDRYLGAFVVLTLLISWGVSLVTVTDAIPAYTTPVMMFTPATVVLVLRRVEGYSIVGTVRRSLRGVTLPSTGFAFLYPAVFIGIAAAIALATGLGTYQPGPKNTVTLIIEEAGLALLPVVLLLNLVLMYGEELGWRGYLLPGLTDRWGRTGATAAVGVVWALFHSAFLYRAAVVSGIGNPLLVTVVQGVAVFAFSFPFAYCYFASAGSVIPVCVLHLTWNVLNPWILGDIYSNELGVVAGRVFVITGEGVLGAILGLVAMVGFVLALKRGIYVRTPGREGSRADAR